MSDGFGISRRAVIQLAAATPALRLGASERAEARVAGLRCEYGVDPVGIDEPHPRLSWAVESDSRGWMQSAFQVAVGSTRQALLGGRPDVWDSGRVESGQSIHIPYAGRQLASFEQCWWRVRVWDAAGAASGWSEPASWTMGVLAEADWQGSRWIGGDDVLENTQETMPGAGKPAAPAAKPAPFLRREFSVCGRIRRVLVASCGLGYAEVSVNGRKLGGEAERNPAFTNYSARCLYVTYDATALVKPGANAIGVILGTGWYDVHDIATWHFNTAPWRKRPRLRLLVAIEYEDGRREFVASDARWKTATGPILRDGIYAGEVYDGRLEMPGWNAVGFDDAPWTPALEVDAPFGRLVAQRCPQVTIGKTIVPVAITEPKPGVFVVDMGQNFAGHVQLRVRAAAGTRITMRYAELLHADGTLDVSGLDQYMAPTEPRQPFQQDTYITKGGEAEEVWEQRFSYSGFRYVEVTGFPGRPTLENFRGRFAYTAAESAGEFSCSNDVVNRIQRATRQSYLSNLQGIPTDCPQREKNGWTADAQLAAETGLMNFRTATFYEKWLEDLADSQRADGGLPVVVPNGGWGNGEGWPGEVTPPWDAAYPTVAWDLYEYCGDTRVLARHYGRLRKYVDFFARYEKDGVTPGLGIGDWAPWKTETPLDFVSTAYLFVDSLMLARMAHVLGKQDDEARYGALAARVKRGFNARFFDAARGTYANGSQTALATALFFGLVPEERSVAVLEKLAAEVERTGHLDTGIVGAKNLLRALAEGGRADLAYRVVVQPGMPGWGYWMHEGATTLWETWKPGASLNHVMFGDVSNWFFQWVGGIAPDPAAPGFRRIRIRPTPVGDLTWAKASHDCLYGRIASEWHKTASAFELKLMIPANTTAVVELPASPESEITESGQPLHRVPGVRAGEQRDRRRIVNAGSGQYLFRVVH